MSAHPQQLREWMSTRPMGMAESAVCGVVDPSEDAFVVPHFSIYGKVLSYRVFNSGRWYKPEDSQPHIYFTQGFSEKLVGDRALAQQIQYNPSQYGGGDSNSDEDEDEDLTQTCCVITLGEDSAVAVQNVLGLPACAVMEVDEWYTKNILLPENVKLKTQANKKIVASIGWGDMNNQVVEGSGAVADGITEFIDLYLQTRRKHVIILWPSQGIRTKETPQYVSKAAALLGYELRFRGLPMTSITHVTTAGPEPVWAHVMRSPDELNSKIRQRISMGTAAFPRHPNPRRFVSGKLQRGRISRKEVQDISMAVLAELDAEGRRYRQLGGSDMYYFDIKELVLHKVSIADPRVPLHSTPFGQHLYKKFNLGGADGNTINWLATQYTGEGTLEDVEIRRNIAVIGDTVYYQLNDSQFIAITGDSNVPFTVHKNGDRGVLFEQSAVEPINPDDGLETLLWKAIDGPRDMWWYNVLKGYRIVETGTKVGELANGNGNGSTNQNGNGNGNSEGEEKQRLLATLLHYLSPWFNRWRGLQLPIELLIGEAGSGKTSLFQLRQSITTGRPKLGNLPHDIKDWFTSLRASGAIHVIDNVNFAGDGKLKQRLSDEYCRLVTDPKPHIGLRKLYTDLEEYKVPVMCTFGMTAIEQPFNTADLLQRAAVFEVKAIGTDHDAQWVTNQLAKGGGRVGWVAHQLAVVHWFLKEVTEQGGWDTKYTATHRLAHYEQALQVMARVFEQDTDWIPEALTKRTVKAISDIDWVVEGIKAFTEEREEIRQRSEKRAREQAEAKGVPFLESKFRLDKGFGVKEISTWAREDEQFKQSFVLCNPWKLGRYIRSHAETIRKASGVVEAGSHNNRTVYKIEDKGSSTDDE